MVFKNEEEEFDVKNMVELLSSTLDQLLASHTQSQEGGEVSGMVSLVASRRTAWPR